MKESECLLTSVNLLYVKVVQVSSCIKPSFSFSNDQKDCWQILSIQKTMRGSVMGKKSRCAYILHAKS